MENNDETGCCCGVMVEESDTLKKMKPILIGGVVIFGILTIVDFCTDQLLFFYYLILGIILLIMTINRCYLVFFYFTFILIVYLFPSLLSQVGIYIQNKFEKDIFKFVIYLISFVLTIVIFYFFFQAYKEMKYLFMNKIQNSPALVGYGNGIFGGGNNTQNYNNSNNSNTNDNKSSGFKAFSGKGYRVGGS